MAKQTHAVEPVFEIYSLDGQPRKARLDFNVFAEFEEQTGKQLVTEGMKELSAIDARLLIYLMLKQEDEDLTVEEVGRLMHVGNFNAVAEELNEVFSKVMPEESEGPTKGGDGNSGNPQSLSTG